ncbi:cellulose synthase complex periplasmic endoglucanase BcsZ [Paraburkholderia phymatum]|uniref:cellulose synthase complex periplasmic endoglucanase BcsZ n=1 Tax=Paraburkholderia phymatum TaxID=148447 RepID=UPI003F75399B
MCREKQRGARFARLRSPRVCARGACMRALACALTLFGCGSAHAATVAPTDTVGRDAPAQAVATRSCGAPQIWPRWQGFLQQFVSADGRVIDVGSADERTVSEGQAYALFFALVANDRASFDRILRWTEVSLAQGDLATHLPAWLWGRRTDGDFAVLDANAASDADLWIAYALLEAGELWGERSYFARGALLAKHVLDAETAYVPGLGLTLLPGPVGFHPEPDLWRVNPSYSPPQVLRGIGTRLPSDARWARVVESGSRVLLDTAPLGYAPDWALYHRGQGFQPDAETHAVSAYNAIRVYLWTGTMNTRDPLSNRLAERFKPYADFIASHGAPPETIDAVSGKPGENMGNAGFSAATLPFLDALGRVPLADAQVARIDTLDAQTPPGYYSSVLSLFGLGWRDGRYRFAADGTLDVRWSAACHGGAR